jgi:hypothetical protein
MELKEVVAGIVLKHGKAMALELVLQAAIPALEEAAQKSPTPVDDAIVAALKQPLVDALTAIINKA